MNGGGGGHNNSALNTAVESFYCNLLILLNTCLFIETIAFFMDEIKMAIIFRIMITAITSIPLVNHFVITNSPFAYCYNHILMAKLLIQLLIEDIFLFLIIRRASFIFYHLTLVFTPFIAFYAIINRDQVSFIIQRIQSSNTQSSMV